MGTTPASRLRIPFGKDPHAKLFVLAALVAFGLVAIACGAAENAPEDREVSSGEELCSNHRGVNAVLAALATATAIELRRWNAPLDFRWNSSSGMLELSAAGKARCRGRACRNVQAVLDMQRWEANHVVKFEGGIGLDVADLRRALKAGFETQVRCNNYWGEFATNGCWVEAHDLWYDHTESGSCNAKDFFWQNKAGTSRSLDVPGRLQYQLYFAGYPNNRMLNWYLRDGQASVDPTVGLTEADHTATGACTALCTEFSTSSLAGQCCQCNGVTKTFSRSPFSYNMYLCR